MIHLEWTKIARVGTQGNGGHYHDITEELGVQYGGSGLQGSAFGRPGTNSGATDVVGRASWTLKSRRVANEIRSQMEASLAHLYGGQRQS